MCHLNRRALIDLKKEYQFIDHKAKKPGIMMRKTITPPLKSYFIKARILLVAAQDKIYRIR